VAVPVDGKAGGLAVVDHVVLGQLCDPADQHPEQQDERSPGPQVQRHGLIGEATVKLLDMVAFGEQPRRFLTRGKRHRQFTDQAAAAGPLQEVAHDPAGGRAGSQPLVQVRLREVAQDLAAVVPARTTGPGRPERGRGRSRPIPG
jgi:hypothetical protein